MLKFANKTRWERRKEEAFDRYGLLENAFSRNGILLQEWSSVGCFLQVWSTGGGFLDRYCLLETAPDKYGVLKTAFLMLAICRLSLIGMDYWGGGCFGLVRSSGRYDIR
jgi:hypothetical protein